LKETTAGFDQVGLIARAPPVMLDSHAIQRHFMNE